LVLGGKRQARMGGGQSRLITEELVDVSQACSDSVGSI